MQCSNMAFLDASSHEKVIELALRPKVANWSHKDGDSSYDETPEAGCPDAATSKAAISDSVTRSPVAVAAN